MDYIYEPAIRTVMLYITLLILTRIIGRKMISQMTFFDYTVGITIGTVVGTSMLGQYNTNFFSTMTILITLTVLILLIGFISIKSINFRKIVNSEPVIVIEKGQIINQNLKKVRLTLNDLTSLLREKNIFNMADVEYALFEHNGKLSVLPKVEQQPLKTADVNINPNYQGLTKDIILDGIVLEANLKDANLNKKWLKQQLNNNNIKDYQEVFYAGLDTNNNLYISKNNKNSEQQGKHGIE